uniref:E-beta-farnesene synthase n=1 Tax=Tanacetum cinerariifolium TaxID=118510 RepID=A0A699K711_TANCI|nr:hypothetical protein [Tanacetum cinerariifolium]
MHVTGDDFLLGNLKFAPKGEKFKVFRLGIPAHLITDAIRCLPYYQKYMDLVAKQPKAKEGVRKKTVSEAVRFEKPAPIKPTKLAVSRKVRKGQGKKAQKDPLKLIDEEEEVLQEPETHDEGVDSDLERAIKLSLDSPQTQGEGANAEYELAVKMSLESFQAQRQAPVEGVSIRERVAEEIRKLPEVKGKGKATVTEEQAAHSLIDPSKKKNDTLEKVVHESSSPTDSERTKSGIEADAPNVVKERDPEESHAALAGPDPKPIHEEFYQTVYPNIHDNLKLRTGEHVTLETPSSTTEHLSSMKNLDETYTFGDQFLNDKPSEDDQGRSLSTSIVDLSASPTTVTTTTTLALPPPPPTQSTTDPDLVARVLVLEKRNADLERAFMSQNRHHDDQDPPSSPPKDDDQDHPPSPPKNSNRRKNKRHNSDASGSTLPLSKDFEQSTKKKQDSDASAAQQPPAQMYSAWKITDTRDAPSGSLMHMSEPQSEQSSNDNPIPDVEHNSDLEGTDTAHLSKMEKYHKPLTDKVDLVNPEGHQIPPNVYEPLPLGGPPGHVTIQPQFFFNKDLDYLLSGDKDQKTALSISKLKAAYYPDFGLEELVPSL